MKRNSATWFSLLLVAAVVQVAAAQGWISNGPLPRKAHSAVFDPSTRQMIIFGGTSFNSFSQRFANNDVWRLLPSASLSGVQSWVASNPMGTPPAERWGQFAGYDPASNRMIVFGGETLNLDNYIYLNDVWVLTNANGNGGPPAWIGGGSGGPIGRLYTAGAYDPISNTLMIYGGQTSGGKLADYWVLSHANGLGGTATWTYFSPLGGGPGPRDGQTAVYDPASNELILFGGSNNQYVTSNDIWILKNANGMAGTPVWQKLFPTGGPPQARAYGSAIYDPLSNVMTIFGGSTGLEGGGTNDTWFLADANGTGGTPVWSTFSHSLEDDPRYRDLNTAVYDASRNVMIIYGGEPLNDDGNVLGDVFFLSHANGQ